MRGLDAFDHRVRPSVTGMARQGAAARRRARRRGSGRTRVLACNTWGSKAVSSDRHASANPRPRPGLFEHFGLTCASCRRRGATRRQDLERP